MNVLVLNGSPRKKSDTMKLTRAFLEGLNEENTHSIDLIDVIDRKIAPCRGCFGCWAKGDGHCVIEDDQNTILDLYKNADLILYSFPLYCYGMPSHLKALLDRTIPLVRMTMVEDENGTVRHVPLVDFSKKKTIVVCGCGFPDFEGNFEALRAQCRMCFGDPLLLFVPETPLLGVPDAEPAARPLLKAFFAAGKEFALTNTLSPATVSRLEHPMIPKEVYIRCVNGQ